MKKQGRDRVYIAGKVTGMPYIPTYYKFQKREKELQDLGYSVFNPMKKCSQSWSYFRCMCVCIFNLLFRCDKISLLDDWQDSRGARIEHKIAMFYDYKKIDL